MGAYLQHKLFRTSFVLIVFAGLGWAASKPDFSGKWDLDVKRSSFGSDAKPVKASLYSQREGDIMHSTQTIYTPQDNQTTKADWNVDGQKHSFDKPQPGYSVTRWEDNALVNERRSNDGQYYEKIRLTLSHDGKTATEEVQSKNPNGDNQSKLIWVKQANQ